jgi:hypothetical protein
MCGKELFVALKREGCFWSALKSCLIPKAMVINQLSAKISVTSQYFFSFG